MDRQQAGREGEDLAVRLALAEGYEILCRNYRCAMGELDLVLRQGDTVVFAEVKARHGDGYGEGWESVTHAKQKRIKKVATWYVREFKLDGMGFRFDVFSIQYKNEKCKYRWYKNAF